MTAASLIIFQNQTHENTENKRVSKVFILKIYLCGLCGLQFLGEKVKHGGVKAVILECVIAECMYVLTKIYKVPRDRAAGSLIDILHYKGIANDDQQELIRALTLCSEHGLDIVDCILRAKAASAEDHLFTFDADLNKLARRT